MKRTTGAWLTGIGLIAASTLGLAGTATAAEVGSSVSDWTTGSKTNARTASSPSARQAIRFAGCTMQLRGGIFPAERSPKQQIQLQKRNAFGNYVAVGNKTPRCSSGADWGARGAGSYRYQLNGVYSNAGTWYGKGGSYLFRANVRIFY